MLKPFVQDTVQLMGGDLESFGSLMFIVKATRQTSPTVVSLAGVTISAATTVMLTLSVTVSLTIPLAFNYY